MLELIRMVVVCFGVGTGLAGLMLHGAMKDYEDNPK
jgi:hypothetical protein